SDHVPGRHAGRPDRLEDVSLRSNVAAGRERKDPGREDRLLRDSEELAFLLRSRRGHQLAPGDDDLAQLGLSCVDLLFVLEPHEAYLAALTLHVRILAGDDASTVEHEAHGLFVVLHEAGEISAAMEHHRSI